MIIEIGKYFVNMDRVEAIYPTDVISGKPSIRIDFSSDSCLNVSYTNEALRDVGLRMIRLKTGG